MACCHRFGGTLLRIGGGCRQHGSAVPKRSMFPALVAGSWTLMHMSFYGGPTPPSYYFATRLCIIAILYQLPTCEGRSTSFWKFLDMRTLISPLFYTTDPSAPMATASTVLDDLHIIILPKTPPRTLIEVARPQSQGLS